MHFDSSLGGIRRSRLGRIVGGALVLATAFALLVPSTATSSPPIAGDIAAELADALTVTHDAAEPTVAVVDPARWQKVANVAAAAVRNAQDDGSGDEVIASLRSLAECAAQWNTRSDSTGPDLFSVCTNELVGVGLSLGSRLLAVLTPTPSEPAAGAEHAPETASPTGQKDLQGTRTGPPAASPAPDGSDTDGVAPQVTDTAPHGDLDTAPHPDTDATSPPLEVPPEPTPRPGSRTLPGLGRFVAPTSGTITSTFGDDREHGGIDIANTFGAPIVAVADGEVISAGPAQGFGLWVRIRHDDGTITTYGHNNTNLVSVGQRVEAGQKIATVGNRGVSTGPHLHFEVETPTGTKTDPVQWLADRDTTIIGVD